MSYVKADGLAGSVCIPCATGFDLLTRDIPAQLDRALRHRAERR